MQCVAENLERCVTSGAYEEQCMRKLIETAALGLSLCLAGLSIATYAYAQDPEEGAVDLKAPASNSSSTWETPPGAHDSEDARASTSASSSSSEAEAAVKEPGPGKWRVFL